MEWRCEWCGKPHEADDPPCDNCGHGTFERAVVQQPASGPAGESTTLWVCTACGREHAKHSPPCSRCGNATLERREYTVEDDELAVPGYFDLVTPQYVLGLAAVLVFATVLGLGLAGVVDLPGMGSDVPEVPTVEGVPGDGESADGLSLAAVESAYVERFNQARTDAGASALERNDHLDDVARYYNQQWVNASVGDGPVPNLREIGGLLGPVCGRDPVLDPVSVSQSDAGSSVEDVAQSLVDARLEDGLGDGSRSEETGVDVHAAGDRLYVTQITC